MFKILSDSLMTATRHKNWDAPDHWRFTDQRPMPDRATCEARERDKRRWMRDTGIM